MKIVPAHDTLAELAAKVADCEEKAETEPEAIATELREKAKQYRRWIKATGNEDLDPMRRQHHDHTPAISAGFP